MLAIMVIAAFYKLPYYVSAPGSAEVISDYVTVEDGQETKGEFMFTTVRMGRANIYSYLWAKVADYHKIYQLNEVRSEDETDEEYSVRQLKLMDESQNTAILNAYRKAGYEATVMMDGIYILHVGEDTPAEGNLKAGDRILEVDGKAITSQKFFVNHVSSKKAGDKVNLKVEREDETLEKTITLKRLKETGNIGIGITLVEDRTVKTEPEVEFNTETIGGPSAGLMFSLEIYNQLTDIDYTAGKKIAGTGTIAEDGTVGPIGGIDQKIVAADEEGAEIFFAPNEEGAKDSDYQIAVKTAKEIGSDMTIVPVDTFDDAVGYLEKMIQ
ncbi:hypothetical protein CYL18_11350 [Pradoshia eiseniae]|uniref:endopeptidase La n=2 Tax=Pradoshia eiseniae TaxID=2064768 RepID=A0A2S7MZ89_9BACI|nr:SepM family pheromone-processing serine protease [Pradoshia eiseniae]PQD95080.1 hypothetical protein CYL18_11350 [Pradoshia eiseniae]